MTSMARKQGQLDALPRGAEQAYTTEELHDRLASMEISPTVVDGFMIRRRLFLTPSANFALAITSAMSDVIWLCIFSHFPHC